MQWCRQDLEWDFTGNITTTAGALGVELHRVLEHDVGEG